MSIMATRSVLLYLINFTLYNQNKRGKYNVGMMNLHTCMTKEVESPSLVTPWYHLVPNTLNIKNPTIRKCSSGGIDGRKMEERGVKRNMARERRWNKKMKNVRGNVALLGLTRSRKGLARSRRPKQRSKKRRKRRGRMVGRRKAQSG
ncbi:hypothetical protein VPH35_078267 [Triticum aestivum]|uniref:Uncharacterized protein n=1 Tax=Aegilops tauschii subsp. strangulata TaxID=200361 RepID=A0A453I7U9_AEGTS